MDWIQFIIFAGGVFGCFFWNRSESRADMRHILSIIDSIQKEMKDFHGRLEKQDAEFKGRMEKQDAEFKGKLALQDAEFKAHLMYHHDNK